MDFARRHGYPVPAVEEISVDGTEMVLERIDGPSMVGAIERRPWNVRRYGAVLAALHRRLHAIPAPDFVPKAPVGHGDRLLHMDLHPLNVVMGPAGPVVIDWARAAAGDPAVDVGLAWVLSAAGEIPAAGWKRWPSGAARSLLVGGFLAHAEVRPARALLAEVVDWKARDAHMSPAETSRMRQLVDSLS